MLLPIGVKPTRVKFVDFKARIWRSKHKTGKAVRRRNYLIKSNKKWYISQSNQRKTKPLGKQRSKPQIYAVFRLVSIKRLANGTLRKKRSSPQVSAVPYFVQCRTRYMQTMSTPTSGANKSRPRQILGPEKTLSKSWLSITKYLRKHGLLRPGS